MFEIDPELEAGYNLRLRHPEREAVYADMARRSAELRRSTECHIDLRYGQSPLETLDVFPAGPGAPVFVFIHGGYWRALDKGIFSFLAAPFLAAGCAVALTNYTLAPAVTLPEIVEQSNDSIAWLALHAGEFGFSPTGIVVAGHSAGGHLAAMAALQEWPRYGIERSPIGAIAPISGLFDLEPLRRTSVNEALRMSPDIAGFFSPLNRIRATGIPAVVAVGAEETLAFREQSRRFHRRWSQAGHAAQYLEPPGRTHFTVLEELADSASPLFQAIRRLIGPGPAAKG